MNKGTGKKIITAILMMTAMAVLFPCAAREVEADGEEYAIVVSAGAPSAETLQECLYELDDTTILKAAAKGKIRLN